MKIYTKTGDNGETSLYGGARVRKDALRIEAYGTVDELNAQLGIVRALAVPAPLDEELGRIQEDLFTLGADLATPGDVSTGAIRRITLADSERLERLIDRLEQSLEPLRHFILPAGTPVAAHLHGARTVCRRAERRVVELSSREPVNHDALVYLNRLSDLLFVMARFANHSAGVADHPWTGGAR